MPHVRKSGRDAIVTAVTGLTTTAARVFVGRVYPLENADLPALLVYLGDEDIKIGSIGVQRQLERNVEVNIEAVFQDLASLDDKGDTILAEVETALGAAGVNLGGLKRLHLARVQIESSDEGEKPTERMKMVFSAFYSTAHGAPTTAL